MREAAADAPVQTCEPAVKPPIAVLPHSTAAARILGRIGDKRAAMPLIKVLPRPSATTKNWAPIAALADLGEARRIAAIDILRGETWRTWPPQQDHSVDRRRPAVEPLLAVLADQTHEDFVRRRWAVIGALAISATRALSSP